MARRGEQIGGLSSVRAERPVAQDGRVSAAAEAAAK